MKIAYHFTCGDFEERYDRHFYKVLFKKYLQFKHPIISSKILIGDLCIFDYLVKGINPTGLLNELIQSQSDTWKRISIEKSHILLKENVFIICFETIQKSLAEQIHQSLIDDSNYIGAFEIDNSVELQWWMYGECIGPKFRIINKDLYILTESKEEENLEYANELMDFFRTFLFDNVKIEYSNYRYSVFDDNHNYENAKRGVAWRRSVDSLFSTITDEIIGKLIDTAPDLTDKLWAITNAFDNAEIGEQYAQAMSSCRRVFEYVTDCLFPATDEITEGHSLKKDRYKNRLMEFANREFKSNTNIDLIVTSTTALFDEWKELYNLSNKGVHSETHRQECRRCIIRTILLLDDIISLRNRPFEVSVKADKYIKKFYEKD